MSNYDNSPAVDDVTEPAILVYFEYEHLPPELAVVSQSFSELAYDMVETLPDNAAREKALEALLISKDWAVRARLPKGKSHV